MSAVVEAEPVTSDDLTLGRRIKVVLVTLSLVGVAGVLVAGHFWNYLGRITVEPTRSGDAISVSVSSLAHRPGFADLTAVVHTTAGRVLRIQSDVRVPAYGAAEIRFDFAPQMRPDEHVTTFKVRK